MKTSTFFKMALGVIFALPLWAQDAEIRFVPEPYPLGVVQQGEVKHIILKGANTTAKDIVLESVMSQNAGASGYKYPAVIKANSTVTIEFDLNTAYLEGSFSHVVVLIDTAGKPYTTMVEGEVLTPLFFSEKMFDAGYYKAGETREWTFYVWSSDKKTRPALELASEAKQAFTASYKQVMLKIDKLDDIKEGGKVPALKVTLKTKGIPRQGLAEKQKSLRHIVAFKSPVYPKATPEVLIVGYWK